MRPEKIVRRQRQLTTGLGQLTADLGQLTTGLGQLTTGLGQLTTGLSQLTTGLGQLTTELSQLTADLGQLEGGLEEDAGGQDRPARNGWPTCRERRRPTGTRDAHGVFRRAVPTYRDQPRRLTERASASSAVASAEPCAEMVMRTDAPRSRNAGSRRAVA